MRHHPLSGKAAAWASSGPYTWTSSANASRMSTMPMLSSPRRQCPIKVRVLSDLRSVRHACTEHGSIWGTACFHPDSRSQGRENVAHKQSDRLPRPLRVRKRRPRQGRPRTNREGLDHRPGECVLHAIHSSCPLHALLTSPLSRFCFSFAPGALRLSLLISAFCDDRCNDGPACRPPLVGVSLGRPFTITRGRFHVKQSTSVR